MKKKKKKRRHVLIVNLNLFQIIIEYLIIKDHHIENPCFWKIEIDLLFMRRNNYMLTEILLTKFDVYSLKFKPLLM
jgi:hypothetical protein